MILQKYRIAISMNNNMLEAHEFETEQEADNFVKEYSIGLKISNTIPSGRSLDIRISKFPVYTHIKESKPSNKPPIIPPDPVEV